MDTKSIVSKLFKIFIITLVIISNSLIQPLSFAQIKADAATTDDNWLTYKLD
ncbi:hypothetical protein H9636_17285 [Ureibacillus sp. Re31]|uniref:Uncharacterized protein n=1 Tax=Ureibacillus galli TaxID=2762222 RepID=A0ABR8XGP3_9BACL|nr:hypothetical protein [Ureibacillus galli]MBD8028396.1 hypothetical protein [Ureibacillus galli]